MLSLVVLAEKLKKAAGLLQTNGLRVLRSALIQLNSELRKLHLFPDDICNDGHAILDLQFLDLPVAELLAKTNQSRPLLRDQLNHFPTRFVLMLATHEFSPGTIGYRVQLSFWISWLNGI